MTATAVQKCGFVCIMGDEVGGACSTYRNGYRILVGKCERTRPLSWPRLLREDDIKMDLKERGQEGVVWINLAQKRTSCGLL
jgi:hypothetical protein